MSFLDYGIIVLYIGGFLYLGYRFKNQADKTTTTLEVEALAGFH